MLETLCLMLGFKLNLEDILFKLYLAEPVSLNEHFYLWWKETNDRRGGKGRKLFFLLKTQGTKLFSLENQLYSVIYTPLHVSFLKF